MSNAKVKVKLTSGNRNVIKIVIQELAEPDEHGREEPFVNGRPADGSVRHLPRGRQGTSILGNSWFD